MSQENVDIVRRLFKAVDDRDLAGVLATYDSEIVIREAESLPYGGVYRGHEGGKQHAGAYILTWRDFQTSAEQKTDPVFLDAGDYVIVLWRQRGLDPSSKKKLDLPAVSVYELRGGKIVESQMYQDTSAILQFLGSKK
jgi:ketosteroid isomerase-like protein